MLELGSTTEITPVTSPSDINFILTFSSFKDLIILSFLCLFKTQAVILSGVVFLAYDSNFIFFSTELSKSIILSGKPEPIAIFSM